MAVVAVGAAPDDGASGPVTYTAQGTGALFLDAMAPRVGGDDDPNAGDVTQPVGRLVRANLPANAD